MDVICNDDEMIPDMVHEMVPEMVPMTDVVNKNQFQQGDQVEEEEERGRWGSQVEYLLSVIGFSVGFSNVLRFPYMCSRNGGGAFLIPYIACLTLCGLPLFYLEVAIGQFCGKGAAHVWSVCPLVKGLGIGMLIMSGGSALYHTMNCAWSVYYAVFACRTILPWATCDNSWNSNACVKSIKAMAEPLAEGNITETNGTLVNLLLTAYNATALSNNLETNRTVYYTAAEEFWKYNVLSISPGLEHLGNVKWELVLCLFVSWFLIFASLAKGVRSVGKVVYVTATLPYAFLFVLLVRGLTLPGGTDGALFYITPNFGALSNIQVWIEACVQVFFSLGPAWGGIITLSSFNKFNSNCLRNATICTCVCTGTSLFAGAVVFSVLGFMAHNAGVPIADVVSSGPGLGFVIYPEALAQLPLPQIWSFVFFIMLILLILDSLMSMVETVISAIMDQYPVLLKWRMTVNAVFCASSFLLGVIFTTEGGMYVFTMCDWYFIAIFFIFGGFLECTILAWVYGVNRVSEDIELMTGKPAPLFFKIAWRFITPSILLTISIVTLAQYKLPKYDSYVFPDYAATIGWCLATIPCIPLVVMMFTAVWRKEGSFLQRLKRSLQPDSSWGPRLIRDNVTIGIRNKISSETCSA